VKRRALLKHLRERGCEFLREGSRHTVYVNREAQRSSTIPRPIPRHTEISDKLARKICKDLGIPPP
jgi:mRNA interferase HicA